MDCSRRIGLCALLLAPVTAFAGPEHGGAFVDFYYVPKANFEVTVPGFGSFDDDGDGFGVRGFLRSGEHLAVTGEYQTQSYDEFDIDLDQVRFGFGFVGPSTSGIFVEYDKLDLDDEPADGFSVHGRLAGDAAPRFQLYADVGYLMLSDDSEDLDGLEFTIGAAAGFSDQLGLFLDYRVTNLEGSESEVDFEFADFRAGGRLQFGG